ncbi:Sua5/YciO/YrdC/YwlC protein family:SUA5:SUA5/yciO/yrdC, N-terminal [Fulvimarina pelagi HTCC2506]|uniref:Threonylcarbamoyl-AMP synthase n=1 Tax=Fulvimarina pelagi HTCC2506 TaxID=314231 RepID=Q0G7T3_9HYPH|nr:Sua5/YciO/YrdC/YwlC protein family:SUA5:SUA5/yciO/yrdC, N-terminal [Fulvimarina pelagi HTCC2506]
MLIQPADNAAAIALASRLLCEGECVVVPTETVYGLAADATNGEAVAKIFAVKERPSFNPLISHVYGRELAALLAHFGEIEHRLTEAFWPGPLTIVAPLRSDGGVHPLATAGLDTIALRQPVGVMAELSARLDRPLAAPSANLSGRVSPTSAGHVAASLGDRVSLILDGGTTSVGVESTIVRAESDRIVLLRPGGVPREAIVEATGLPVETILQTTKISAPGQMSSHYAPFGRVRLDAASVEPGEWLIAFGPEPVRGESSASGVVNLSPSGNLEEAAANLFGLLARLDRPDVPAIAVVPIPNEGIGEAINDRLKRAAAPR